MSELAAALRAADARHRDLLAMESDRARRLDYLAFQLREIEALAPRAGEIEELTAEVERTKHREELAGATRQAAEDLYEGDGSVYERLSAHAAAIGDAARLDENLSDAARALTDAAAIVEETSRRLGRYGDGAEEEPDRLDELIERLDALRALTRKHGTDLSGVIAAQERIAAEVAELTGYEEALTRSEAERDLARRDARQHAEALGAARRKAAKKLGRAVAGELADLKLTGAQFDVDLQNVEGDPGPAGAERIEFLVALNPGEGIHPLREVASGGELSRLMLALRRALAGVGPVGTYVFDEVDAGIGGAEAALVGKKLKEVARHHQVVCVTHLAQIAGLADEHFVVRKTEKGGRTRTEVRRLNREERVTELARMLGGEKPTEKTVAAARELMAG